jgi:hypothetical protein
MWNNYIKHVWAIETAVSKADGNQDNIKPFIIQLSENSCDDRFNEATDYHNGDD